MNRNSQKQAATSEPIVAESISQELPELSDYQGRILAISLKDWSQILCVGDSVEEVHELILRRKIRDQYFVYAVPVFGNLESVKNG